MYSKKLKLCFRSIELSYACVQPINTVRMTKQNAVLYQLMCLFLRNTKQSESGNVLKGMVHALAVRLASYGCTWKVGSALEKIDSCHSVHL